MRRRAARADAARAGRGSIYTRNHIAMSDKSVKSVGSRIQDTEGQQGRVGPLGRPGEPGRPRPETAAEYFAEYEAAFALQDPHASPYELPRPPMCRYHLADTTYDEHTGEPQELWVDATSAPVAAALAERHYGPSWQPSPETGRKRFSRVEWVDAETGEGRSLALTMEGAAQNLADALEAADRGGAGGAQ